MWEDAHSLHEQFPISNLEDKLILRGWNIKYISITKGRKQYEVSFLIDAINFIKENNDYHVFDESPHNEGF
jgi:hypothetical protein